MQTVKELKPQEFFLKDYNILPEQFEKTKIKWVDLEKIYTDHFKNISILNESGQFILNNLMKADRVHSVRVRVKDPEHLIEKIIRKRIIDPSKEVTLENYHEKVTDLIGVRALHLFKNSWQLIHEHIHATWEQHEQPTVYFRDGDDTKSIKQYEDLGCLAREHPFGYRSVHYIIKSKPAKKENLVEIQTRTIYEEAWSEIDHHIRYPYKTDNEILNQFLLVLNRLSGSADEMATFIKTLQNQLGRKDSEIKKQTGIIKDLESKLSQKKLSESDIKEMRLQLKQIELPTLNFNWESYLKSLSSQDEAVKGSIAYPRVKIRYINPDQADIKVRSETIKKQSGIKDSDSNKAD